MTFNKHHEIVKPFAVRLGDVLYFDDLSMKSMQEAGYMSAYDTVGIQRPKYTSPSLDPSLYGYANIPGFGRSIIDLSPEELIRLKIKKPDELITPNNWVMCENDYLLDLHRRGELPTGIFLRARYGNVNGSRLAEIIDQTLNGKKLIEPLGIVYRPLTIQGDSLKIDLRFVNFVIDSKDVETVEVLRNQ